MAELQAQIDRFVFNEQRPHTACGAHQPMQAWRALDKAPATIDGQPLLAHTKVRRDRIDKIGCFTLRYRSKLDTSQWDEHTKESASWSWWLTSTFG